MSEKLTPVQQMQYDEANKLAGLAQVHGTVGCRLCSNPIPDPNQGTAVQAWEAKWQVHKHCADGYMARGRELGVFR